MVVGVPLPLPLPPKFLIFMEIAGSCAQNRERVGVTGKILCAKKLGGVIWGRTGGSPVYVLDDHFRRIADGDAVSRDIVHNHTADSNNCTLSDRHTFHDE